MKNQIVFAAILLLGCVIGMNVKGLVEDTSRIVSDLEYLLEGYYTAQVDIGSNDQPEGDDAPHSYFLLDLQTTELLVTNSEIKGFDGKGVFNSSSSTTFVQVSTEETKASENNRDLTGYWVKDSFGLRNSPQPTKVEAMDFFLIETVDDSSQ